MRKCLLLFGFVLLLFGLVTACRTGPSEACDDKTTCREGYRCVLGWCVNNEVEINISEQEGASTDGGSGD